MKKFNSLFFSFFFLLIGYSCSKDYQVNEKGTSASFASIDGQKVGLYDGRLCFNSKIEFQNAVNSIVNKKVDVIGDQFISRRQFLESAIQLKGANLSGEEHLDDSDTLVYSDAFCSILNENREVQIGNIFVKITPIGTILLNAESSKVIAQITFDDNFLSKCMKVNSAFGIISESDLYESSEFKGVYLFDTYSLLKKNKETNSIKVFAMTSSPVESDFDIMSDGKTWAGNLISSIIGFSKSDYKRFSDRDYCVDVKFYSQNFFVYSEAGIKTKTQKQGWTGIWSKVDSDELISGYDRLILTEKWPSKLFPSITNVTANFPKSETFINGMSKTYYDFKYTQQKLAKEVLTTRNILGIDIDITNKDVSRALWNILEPAWKWGNSSFGSGTTQKVALRVLEENLQTSKLETFDRSIRESNTDKLTYILDSDFGFIISLPGSSSINWLNVVDGVAAKFHYSPGTVLYGCARRGNEWRGLKLVFD